MPSRKKKVRLLSKADCHLCDVAKAVIEDVRKQHFFDLEVVDITSDAALFDEFKEQIPVVFVDGRKAFKYRLTHEALLARLRK